MADAKPAGEDLAALKTLSEQTGVPGIDLHQVCIRLADLELVPRDICEQRAVLPVLVKNDRIFVAMASPSDRSTVQELEFATGRRVFPYVALRATLLRVVGECFDLKAQGRRHYVGPNCPPEIIQRAGVSVPPPAEAKAPGPGSPPPRRAPPPPQRASAPSRDAGGLMSEDSLRPAAARGAGVVVDDTIGRVGGPPSPDVFVEATHDGAGEPSMAPADGLELEPDGEAPVILVVDDEPDVRRLLVRVLQDRGYRTLEADNGETALQMVGKHLPDLVVLDAMLPKVHGFDIARRLRDTERYGHIPIVMVSAVYRGWRFAEDVKANYGVSAYLEKPFKVQDVVAAVETALTTPSKRSADPDALSDAAEKCLRAGILAYKAGNYDEAAAHLREGTGTDPLAYRIHFQLGLLYAKTGQLYDAIQSLEAALGIRSGYFPALKNLAFLYQNAGFRNKAIEMWERSLAAAPDDPTRESIKRQLLALL
ncbi:MAG: response regulator [Polyangiaceae bacterium]|nr:response regulator [Polyangiaceae bacterium]